MQAGNTGGGNSRAGYGAGGTGSPADRDLNRQLQSVANSQQLLDLLWPESPSPAASKARLSPINIATAWVKLAHLASGGGGGRGRGAERNAGERSPEEEARTAAVELLLRDTAAATEAPAASSGAGAGGGTHMDLRQVANTLWGMAKVRDELPSSSPGGARAGTSAAEPARQLREALQRLQQRAVDLLQPMAAAATAAAAAANAPAPGSGKPGAVLDLRDAAQLWYALGGLRHPWSGAFTEALGGATVAALEAVLAAGEVDPAGPVVAAAAARTGGAGGGRGGGGRGGGGGGAAVESRTAAAQLVFRMGTQMGGGGLQAPLRARLAAVVEGLSAAAQPPNPDCLLTGAHLLRLPLPPAVVRRLHDAALSCSGGEAARAGRVAMARALHSAVQLGLQPASGEAARWEARLLEELGPGAAGRQGAPWRSEELSWTLLALSGVRVYAPEGEARERIASAVCGVLRKARANDATRLRAAVGAWGLRLPARERALLAQKAGEDVWEGDDALEQQDREREEAERGRGGWQQGQGQGQGQARGRLGARREDRPSSSSAGGRWGSW
ncbi:hypothetical protein HYH02_002985 [Chlamydomonas schloesseri]|uniref:Uncharacterized protein n=1 Tax=Chlamydomonas schloesseri TaxID=2026947 RepID=A0A835WSA1_9CHLO|nr:hypothetical protein HYH02_002985 [Chlamydomonas schloesseri]|eukprot:KAG2452755.1 hypothetical protein HYH02_002985 [Chlamydomonas schloesseri]